MATYGEDGLGRTGQMPDPFFCSESAGRPLRLFGIHFHETESSPSPQQGCEICWSFTGGRVPPCSRSSSTTFSTKNASKHSVDSATPSPPDTDQHRPPSHHLILFNLEGLQHLSMRWSPLESTATASWPRSGTHRLTSLQNYAKKKKENQWFLYDDNSSRGPYLFPVPRLKYEASMSGARSLFLGRLQ